MNKSQAFSGEAAKLQTPFYIVDEQLLCKNLAVLRSVMERTGCKILLAQKAFSMYYFYPLIGQYLCGATASGLYEARLAKEEMKGENHIFSPAYKDDEIDEILEICDHIVFNSFSQWDKYKEKAMAAGKECGIRINPEYSTQDHAIYDPCAPYSRLGVTLSNFCEDKLEGISGLHFHTLCEQNAQDLEKTLQVVEDKFGKYLYQMKWLNFGGGHHITRDDYEIDRLIRLIDRVQKTYDLEVYLEPGEAVALDAGFLVSSVLDLNENGKSIAILDTSAACHMPDVIEMPYRPRIIDAGEPGEKKYSYILGGPTCLSGDIIGEYSFEHPIQNGDKLIFEDMAIYSMVKNNTFNGMQLPTIAARHADGSVKVVKQFGYEDFKMRLS